MKSLLLLVILVAVCAVILFISFIIEPSVPIAGPDDPFNATEKRK